MSLIPFFQYNNAVKKRLSVLTGKINILSQAGPDREITGIFYDSRRVIPGGLFAATGGLHTDGHRFISAALDAGAEAVVYSDPAFPPDRRATFIRTENPRLDLPPLAAAFYGHPGRELTVTGVTGTDGKTSTVFLIHQLLGLLGEKSGFLSTATYQAGGDLQKNPYRQSTPEAPEVQEILRQMADSGCRHAILEATSHGLSPLTGRLADVPFSAGVFTNISHEHLEFHGTFENYRRDKSRLFARAAALGREGLGVLNRDDPNWEFFLQTAREVSGEAPIYTYSRKDPAADIYCREIRPDQRGSGFTFIAGGREHAGRLNIPGDFSIENVMAAMALVKHRTGCSWEEMIPLLPELTGVKGRMKTIDQGQPFTVIVDYAHTPGAYEKMLPDVRNTTPGRVLAVFSSAGERDLAKRPMLGEIAGRYCDILILADEDPRGEDSMQVLKDVAAGAKNKTPGKDLFFIPPRQEAILETFKMAREKDTVLLLGKGHESTIIYADGPIPWDEETAARECLDQLGWRDI